MTTDTSTEAVERACGYWSYFCAGSLAAGGAPVVDSVEIMQAVALLRALSRERDEWKKRAEKFESDWADLVKRNGELLKKHRGEAQP